jgi:hypothetical protein
MREGPTSNCVCIDGTASYSCITHKGTSPIKPTGAPAFPPRPPFSKLLVEHTPHTMSELVDGLDGTLGNAPRTSVWAKMATPNFQRHDGRLPEMLTSSAAKCISRVSRPPSLQPASTDPVRGRLTRCNVWRVELPRARNTSETSPVPHMRDSMTRLHAPWVEGLRAIGLGTLRDVTDLSHA